MADPDDRSSDYESGKHAQARQLAEKALIEQAAGNDDEADALFDAATRADPSAVDAVLSEAVVTRQHPVKPSSDEEIAAMSRRVEPGSAAPSRSGITDSGSGADGERR